ncbi:MAG: glycosyltransferase family 4 protein [Sandaracinus sp.]|nr:glycosyltransferase family 4 protein [Sandaracinus sp.]
MSQRIGYLTSQYPAPSHTFIRREVEALREQGIELDTFSVRPPKDDEVSSALEQDERDRTYYLLPPEPLPIARAVARALVKRPKAFVRTLRQAFEHRPPGTRGAAYAGVYFLEAMHLAAALDQRGIDHLHNHFANSAAIVGHLATSYLDIDWSFTVHGISEFDYPAGLLLGDKIRKAKFVACVSHFGRSQALRTVEPSLGDKMIIVRCGVALSQMPQRHRRDDGRFRFVSVARLSPEKGHVGLIKAFARVARERPEADLLLVGEGPRRPIIEAAIAEHGLADRVRLLGQMTERDVLTEVANSDALVVSSLMEGLPVVLMEAMAIGVPVIAPAVGGIPELVEHDVTGLIFTVSNWNGLASRMLALASNIELGDRLAVAGRRRVEEEFDVRRAVEPLRARFG